MRVLGIESSCDDTGVAIYDSEKGLIGHALSSQIALHQQYGGVVPELASRDHIKHLIPLVNEALNQTQLKKTDLDVIAYTAGPGLIGALLTGACFAKSFAYSLDIPAIAVHHLEAHLLAARLEMPTLEFPFLVLLVSGGHTQLLQANTLGKYDLLGETLDDAVGEAFDKTAKLMGIAYPGGPVLAALADDFQEARDLKLPPFPRPMTNRPGLDFSFSGLKTHALTCWNNTSKDESAKRGVAYAFQEAIIDTLLIKCKRALASTHIKKLVVAGGVGANHALRKRITTMMQDLQGQVYFPRMEFCTDNGAMIAYTGYLHFINSKKDENLAIDVKARWPINNKS